jgi:hypothetical protein
LGLKGRSNRQILLKPFAIALVITAVSQMINAAANQPAAES